MPYGNKELHFGHIGGVFVHADTFARFLRDRIGKDNVIFVSGTDCYGSPIFESHRRLTAEGTFKGSLDDFVTLNHIRQKEVLDAYHIGIDLFAASGLGRASEIHREVSGEIIKRLYDKGLLKKMSTMQFYDALYDTLLNGRQVTGQCPIAGCNSERGYADECSSGHQYMPSELINPISALSGKKPDMREVTNWYFKLDDFHSLLEKWVAETEKSPSCRTFAIKSIREFLEPPVIYVKQELLEMINKQKGILPEYELKAEEGKSSVQMVFETLEKREQGCKVLSENLIRYRTGKTLVPFRLTGNIEWGVPAPVLEGLSGLTVWVWPESLWAPISFTRTYLEQKGAEADGWKDWWCSGDSGVYQFIGEDNVYFYGPVEMAMFMGCQKGEPSVFPSEGELNLPELIVNNHILFMDKKASSSGEVKPPMAGELLDYYTAEQLRAHYLSLGLGIRSVGFQPKPLNPEAREKDGDPVLKEGNLLCNVFNRFARSCFYTAQKIADRRIPEGEISPEVLEESDKTILEYERLMYRHEFHLIMSLMDTYIRNANKYWAKNMQTTESDNNTGDRLKVLTNAFHMLRTMTVLMHPVSPVGTEMILDYLNLSGDFWDWGRIFEPIRAFISDPDTHKLKFLEPRVDFFDKHPSQVGL